MDKQIKKSESIKISLGGEVNTFIKHIDSLNNSLPLIMLFMNLSLSTAFKPLSDFIEKNSLEEFFQDTDNAKQQNLHTKLDIDSIRLMTNLIKQVEYIKLAGFIIPNSFVVSLISQFDAYLGRLIRFIFYTKPDLLNGSEKNLSFSKLLEFSSFEDAKEYIVEKEIESVLRNSHAEQFKWLENKLDTTLTTDLPIWPTFIELTERRNLFVHCNGIVSSQYMNVCKAHKVVFENERKVGDKLEATQRYFQNAYKCIFEIGVKLAHVIGRKIAPQDREKFDTNLGIICYDLICQENYDLAMILLEFATTTLKKYSSEEQRLRFIINKAQTVKWIGNNEECKKILSSVDWSACSNKFKLANAVLLEDYSAAIKLMKVIGQSDEVSKFDYKHWPMFKIFCKTEEFLKVYEEIFNEPFMVAEVPPNLMNKIFGLEGNHSIGEEETESIKA